MTLKRRIGNRIRIRYLAQILGVRQAWLFVVLSSFLYLILFVAISYALLGSVANVVGAFSADIDAGGFELQNSSLIASFLSALLMRVLFRLSVGTHRISQIVKDFLVLLIAIPIVGTILFFVFGVPILIAEPLIEWSALFPELNTEFYSNLSWILGLGFTAVLFAIRADKSLPDDLVEAINEAHSMLEGIKNLITKAEMRADRGDFIAALETLDKVQRKLDDIRNCGELDNIQDSGDGNQDGAEPARSDAEQIGATRQGQPQPQDRRQESVEGSSDRIAATKTRGVSDQIAATEARLADSSERIAEELLSTIRDLLSDEKYIKAAELLTQIEQMEQTYDFADTTITSLRNDIDENLSDIVASKMDTMADSLDRAEQAKEDGEFDQAREHLQEAMETGDNIRDITSDADIEELETRALVLKNDIERAEQKEQAHDFRQRLEDVLEQAAAAKEDGDFQQAHQHVDQAERLESSITILDIEYEMDNLSARVSELRGDIRQAEEAAQIQNHREQIAKLFDIDESKVSLRGHASEPYKKLEETLTELETLKREYRAYPWNDIELDIIGNLPGMSYNQIQTYSQIISESGKILRYLEMVSESHPSIDAGNWRDAVTTALEESYPDILNPIISQIDRLQGGLWNREHLYEVSWDEFERLVGSLYESQGYSVEVTQDTADEGVDVWIEKNSERGAVQVKQFSTGNTVGRQTLQRLVSTIAKDDADTAIVVTSGEFATTASQYAKDFGPNLKLIDGDELIRMLSESDVPPPL